MSKFLKFLLIPILLLPTITASAPTAKALTDITPEDKYYVAISYLLEQGFISGYEDQTFRANQPVNKAEALKMIFTALKPVDEATLTASYQSSFADVNPTAWYAPYVSSAETLAIISGDGSGNFYPEKTINLGETLKILLKSADPTYTYTNVEGYIYNDTPAEAWFTPFTSHAGSKEIINVYSNNNVNPEQEMTRGYLAELLYRFLKSKEGIRFGKATFYGKAVQGAGTASGETFDYNKLTAAHRTLPFGTIVRVTNLANGKTVDVKINDRGPHGPGRVLDLSEGAFEAISWLGNGIINVQYQVIEQ